jgi:hypothetical protein
MENKQTAVEWLEERYNDPLLKDNFISKAEFDQAKAIEKEQIIDFTRKAVRKIFDEDRQNPFNLEQYYKETYEQ